MTTTWATSILLDHVTPDSRSGSLCASSDISLYVYAESDKEGTSSTTASDEVCEQENSKFG